MVLFVFQFLLKKKWLHVEFQSCGKKSITCFLKMRTAVWFQNTSHIWQFNDDSRTVIRATENLSVNSSKLIIYCMHTYMQTLWGKKIPLWCHKGVSIPLWCQWQQSGLLTPPSEAMFPLRHVVNLLAQLLVLFIFFVNLWFFFLFAQFKKYKKKHKITKH